MADDTRLTLQLRPDQQPMLTAVERRLRMGGQSILLQAPTGWGKTVMFCTLARDHARAGQRVMVLVHRAELLEQVSQTLTHLGVPHGRIAPSIAPTEHPVQVASVFTVARRVETVARPDLVIIDEAHHAIASTTWGRLLTAWAGVPRIGVTATPERLSGEGLRELFEELLIGPSVQELIQGKHLSSYRLYAPPQHATDHVATRMGDFAKGELADAMDTPTITGDAVVHYRRLGANKRAVAFCVSIAHAEHVAEEFRAAGFTAQSIDGTLSASTRQARIAAFRAKEIQILTSCDLISEGFDLPALEVAILLRPTKSLALYLQQVGRALRPYPDKDYALILDHAGNALRHGFPDDPRRWSLQGREKKPSKGGESAPACRTCERCFAAVRVGTTSCPYCQYVFPIKSREIEQVEGTLEECTRTDHVCRQCGDTFGGRYPGYCMWCARDRRTEVGRAKDLQELLRIQAQRGYKNGWAYHILRSRAGQVKG